MYLLLVADNTWQVQLQGGFVHAHNWRVWSTMWARRGGKSVRQQIPCMEAKHSYACELSHTCCFPLTSTNPAKWKTFLFPHVKTWILWFCQLSVHHLSVPNPLASSRGAACMLCPWSTRNFPSTHAPMRSGLHVWVRKECQRGGGDSSVLLLKEGFVCFSQTGFLYVVLAVLELIL